MASSFLQEHREIKITQYRHKVNHFLKKDSGGGRILPLSLYFFLFSKNFRERERYLDVNCSRFRLWKNRNHFKVLFTIHFIKDGFQSWDWREWNFIRTLLWTDTFFRILVTMLSICRDSNQLPTELGAFTQKCPSEGSAAFSVICLDSPCRGMLRQDFI